MPWLNTIYIFHSHACEWPHIKCIKENYHPLNSWCMLLSEITSLHVFIIVIIDSISETGSPYCFAWADKIWNHDQLCTTYIQSLHCVNWIPQWLCLWLWMLTCLQKVWICSIHMNKRGYVRMRVRVRACVRVCVWVGGGGWWCCASTLPPTGEKLNIICLSCTMIPIYILK